MDAIRERKERGEEDKRGTSREAVCLLLVETELEQESVGNYSGRTR